MSKNTKTISEFKTKLAGGGARPNLFEVKMPNFPAGIIDQYQNSPWSKNEQEDFAFMCKAAQLPASNTPSIPVPFRGRILKVAGDRTFDDWTVTIINDEDFLIRNAMENWMASINSHEGNVTQAGTASASEYKAQAQITQYSKTGAPLRTYNFNGLFPTNIAAIGMDWNTTDDIERFDVTFQYDWWNVSGGVTGDGGTNE